MKDTLELKDLKRLEAEGPAVTERPDVLPLEDIHTAPLVFQWRPANEELAAEAQLMTDLVRHIEGDDPPRALDPLVVTAIGDRFFVLDGHHRLDAYRRARWKGPVPVRHFKGTLKEAEATALRLNVKNKLPMTRDARSEAAWRMLVDGAKDPTWKRTRKEIMEVTLASKSTVKRMARALRELGKEALDMTWADVLRRNFQDDLDAMDDEGMDAWKKEKARKLADHLVKGPSLIKDPEITAMALKMVSEMLPTLLVDQWRIEVLELALNCLDAHAPAEARRAIEEAISL